MQLRHRRRRESSWRRPATQRELKFGGGTAKDSNRRGKKCTQPLARQRIESKQTRSRSTARKGREGQGDC